MSCHFHVIVPTFNRVHLLERCLDCLAAQDDGYFSVIVVNDGSTDGTTELLNERFPNVNVVQGDGNLWWTGAVHKAIEGLLEQLADQPDRLSEDAIVLINDDLEFDAGFISTLRSIRNENPDTLIGSVVVDISDRSTITHGGWNINWLTAKDSQQNRGAKLASFPENYFIDVSTLTGRGVLIPLSVICDVGSYNKSHYPQHGDYELPVRASRAGYKLKTFYKSIVYCHFDLKGDFNTTSSYGLTNIHHLLIDKRSYLNIKEKLWFAFDTRKNPLQFLIYLIFSMARLSKSVLQKLIEHYVRKWSAR